MCTCAPTCAPVSGVTGISFVSPKKKKKKKRSPHAIRVCEAAYPTPANHNKQGDRRPSQIILHPPPLVHESPVHGSRVSEQQKPWETFSYC